MHLAENGGVAVTGLTLSAEELWVAQATARQRGLGERVASRREDYHEHAGTYDRIVSVGMFEHVGKPHYAAFLEKVATSLPTNGVALLHTITSKAPPEPVNPWVRCHIFPGGYISSLSDIAPFVERVGPTSADIEVLRTRHALTLRAWSVRFQRHRRQFVDSKGERFCRMWEFYLVACQTAFEVSDLIVLQ